MSSSIPDEIAAAFRGAAEHLRDDQGVIAPGVAPRRPGDHDLVGTDLDPDVRIAIVPFLPQLQPGDQRGRHDHDAEGIAERRQPFRRHLREERDAAEEEGEEQDDGHRPADIATADGTGLLLGQAVGGAGEGRGAMYAEPADIIVHRGSAEHHPVPPFAGQ